MSIFHDLSFKLNIFSQYIFRFQFVTMPSHRYATVPSPSPGVTAQNRPIAFQKSSLSKTSIGFLKFKTIFIKLNIYERSRRLKGRFTDDRFQSAMGPLRTASFFGTVMQRPQSRAKNGQSNLVNIKVFHQFPQHILWFFFKKSDIKT